MNYRSLKIAMSAGALCLALGVVALAGGGSYAENPYSPTANGHQYRHGVVPTRETWHRMKSWQALNAINAAVTGSETLSYGGGLDGIGVTSGTPKVYLVVYGSQWGSAPGVSFGQG